MDNSCLGMTLLRKWNLIYNISELDDKLCDSCRIDLVGSIGSDSIADLISCKKNIETRSFKFCILNFRDVMVVKKDALPYFKNIVKVIRSKTQMFLYVV